MNSTNLLEALLRLNLVASAAILLVLLVRPSVLRRLGVRSVWWLWLVVPVALLASLVPAREQVVFVDYAGSSQLVPVTEETLTATPDIGNTVARSAGETPAWTLGFADLLVLLWLGGATTLLARSIAGTRRLAADPATGPALVGVFRPRLILPPDFTTRFDAAERALILAHEESHRVSGHALINALVELVRCSNWFNPLMHVAADRIRHDEELVCDAAVIAAHPQARRTYAQALLKARLASAFLPLGCTWTSRSAARLGERITVLAQIAPGRRGLFARGAAITLLGLAAAYTAWAQQPERVVTQVTPPQAAWTLAADAPAGTLSHALEGARHDLFIDLAQRGAIDFVLFGTTDAEMFWWPDRGKRVWERAFAGLNAVNFGAQGSSPRSLLWRMRNGELDGYAAKLIVLQAAFCLRSPANAGRAGASREAVVEDCAPIIAEIRARQPQAKILLLPPFPRGFDARDAWRVISAANAAAVAPLVDDETVFYADFGARFFLADGSHDDTMWARSGINGVGVGIQPAAFEAWAEELQPWIERFLR